jgi:predicted TIM-barrel fold metal-dependent hydrolase
MGDYRHLPENFPDLKIVYLHAGVPFFREVWDFAKGHSNVFFDLSSPYNDDAIVEEAVGALGAERCLYGTDGPYGYQAKGEDYDYSMTRGWIEKLDVEDKERILRKNFEALTGS